MLPVPKYPNQQPNPLNFKMYFSNFLLIAFLLIFSYESNANLFGVTQRVSVKGKLLCGTQPAANIFVKLVDKDIGLDDEMARTKTNANGEFQVEGTQNEMGEIDPYLKIFHDCNDAGVPCQRKMKLRIPSKYITRSNATKEIADIGILNLEVDLRKEERDCFP